MERRVATEAAVFDNVRRRQTCSPSVEGKNSHPLNMDMIRVTVDYDVMDVALSGGKNPSQRVRSQKNQAR
jgi:hypothetical protein